MLVYGSSEETMLMVAVCRNVKRTLERWFPYDAHKAWEPFQATAAQTWVLSTVTTNPVCRRQFVEYQACNHPVPNLRLLCKVFNPGTVEDRLSF